MVKSSIVWSEQERELLSVEQLGSDQVESALVSARRLIEGALADHRERQTRGHALFESHASEDSLWPLLARFLHQAGHRPVVVQASSRMWLREGREVPRLRSFREGLRTTGNELRLLVDAESAAEPDIAERLNVISEAGVGLRVGVAELPGVLVLDRTAVVLSVLDPDRPDRRTLALVRLPEIVTVMNELVGSAWSGAVGLELFQQRAELQEGLIGRILRLLRMGYKDEAAAKVLGLSVRTYRRHVAVLMDRLNANSRFQAGAQAAVLGL